MLDAQLIFEMIGQIVTIFSIVLGSIWAFEKWRKRDEHFPRVVFEVSVNFIGVKNNKYVIELVAFVENKGVVPLKLTDFSFKLLGLKSTDNLEKGGDNIRNQLLFPHVVEEGLFAPERWGYTFIYPEITTEYNFVCFISKDFEFLRMQADFKYSSKKREHHAAKILKIPSVRSFPDDGEIN